MSGLSLHHDLTFAIDPGSYRTGWSILDEREQLLQAGVIVPDKRDLASEFRIAQICDGLRDLLDEWRPAAIIVEWTSGKVNLHRHRGAGAGLAIHGAATGSLWREAAAWRRSLPAELRDQVKIILPRENDWTRQTHKADRIAAVASDYPAYRPADDLGGDVADAIALNQWYLREQQARSLVAVQGGDS